MHMRAVDALHLILRGKARDDNGNVAIPRRTFRFGEHCFINGIAGDGKARRIGIMNAMAAESADRVLKIRGMDHRASRPLVTRMLGKFTETGHFYTRLQRQ